jgi:AcrR family transcriptional regulator
MLGMAELAASAGHGGVADGPVLPSRRERVRASTVAEIKAAALDLMRERGSMEVHFADIARVMGMTAPALYRYFDDRDALLTALIEDAYSDLADALEQGSGSVPADDLWERLRASMAAYRAWGVTQPERFALIFGRPIPGFAVSEDSGSTDSAARAMGVIESIVLDAQAQGRLQPSIVTHVAPGLAALVADKHTEGVMGLPPAAFQGVLQAWIGVHGFVVLEAFGQLAWFPDSALEGLYEAQVELVARAMGIEVPQP